MSSEKEMPKSTVPSGDENGSTEVEQQGNAAQVDPVRPLSQTSFSSPSTEESVSAFIERIATCMGFPTRESEISDIPIPMPATVTSTIFPELLKVFVSDPIVVSQDVIEEKTGPANEPESTSQSGADPLYGDTSDAEELLDSSGVDAFPPITSSMAWDPSAFPEFEGEFRAESGHSDTEQEQYRARVANSDRQLSVKGRSVIRKYFTAATPVQLPAGHTTIAFNEDQVHAILRTVADESVISSYHMMKSLLLHATSGTSQDKKKSMTRRCPTPARRPSISSGDESSFGGNTSDGYTSGAFNTDEDPYQVGSISGTDGVSETGPSTKRPETSLRLTPSTSRAEVTTPTSGSGYSSTDHQPLSVLRRPRESDVATPSPPRKRRKLLSKPGKVMKDAYFKGIQWTRTFVSGPLDPVHNKFKFYCMLCKTNVSIYSKGAREILRHYRTEGHLRKDQKWRYVHLQETDEITGNVTHQVRGKDGWVLTPVELEKEKPLFMDVPLIEAGDRFPFFEDYMASIGGITNPDDLRTSTLISLCGTFIPKDGNFSLLQSLWTKVGQFTNHQALFSSFDWGSATLTVSISFPRILMAICCGVTSTELIFSFSEYLPPHLHARPFRHLRTCRLQWLVFA